MPNRRICRLHSWKYYKHDVVKRVADEWRRKSVGQVVFSIRTRVCVRASLWYAYAVVR